MTEMIDMDDMNLEEEKLKRMINRIYRLERENTKTENATDKVIKQKIIAIIEEEAKKCY